MSIWTILFVVLLIAWIGGFTVFHVAGGLIHLLLVLAVISLIVHFVRGPKGCGFNIVNLRLARITDHLYIRDFQVTMLFVALGHAVIFRGSFASSFRLCILAFDTTPVGVTVWPT